jgi:hypothetical protein
MSTWTCFWCSLASPDFKVCGISFEGEIFKQFKDTLRNVSLPDPIYQKPHNFRIYRLDHDGSPFHIAYMEVSPSAYLAYADDKTLPFARHGSAGIQKQHGFE